MDFPLKRALTLLKISRECLKSSIGPGCALGRSQGVSLTPTPEARLPIATLRLRTVSTVTL